MSAYIGSVNLLVILMAILLITGMVTQCIASSIQSNYYMHIRVGRSGYVRVWTNEIPLVFNNELVIKFRYVVVGYGTLSIVLYHETPVSYAVLTKYVEEHSVISRVRCLCINNSLGGLSVRPDVENVLIIKVRHGGVEVILNGVKVANCSVDVPKELRLAIVARSILNSEFSIGFLSIVIVVDGMETIPKGWAIVKVGDVGITYLGKSMSGGEAHQVVNPMLIVGVLGVISVIALLILKKFLRRSSW